MHDNIVERWSGNLHYYVKTKTASDVCFPRDVYDKLKRENIELSVTGISKYIRSQNIAYTPVLLTWDMTSHCNFNCPFCYIRNNNSSDKDVSFDEAKEVIDGLINAGLFEVYLSGGECLLLKDFLKIYKYLKQNGVFVTVFTNGSLIDDEILECWSDYPPTSVEITLYDDNYSSKTYQNILKLIDMDIFILPKFTLTNTNFHYLENVKKWTDEHNIALSIDANILNGIDKLHSGLKEKFSLSTEQKEIYVPNNSDGSEAIFGIKTGFSCKSKRGIIQISSDYTVSLCNKMKKRWNLRNVKIETALGELRELIKKYESKVLNGCAGCNKYKSCEMCYANATIIDGELYVPKGYCDKLNGL